MATTHKLTPEYLRAVEKLDASLCILTPSTDITSEVWEHGNLSSYLHTFTIRRIPSENHWRWNQTNRKMRVFLTRYNANVTISKLIPRKTYPKTIADSPSLAVPSYKLWQFLLQFTSENQNEVRRLVVMWCEKGKRTENSILQRDFSSHHTPNDYYQEMESNVHLDRSQAAKLSFILN